MTSDSLITKNKEMARRLRLRLDVDPFDAAALLEENSREVERLTSLYANGVDERYRLAARLSEAEAKIKAADALVGCPDDDGPGPWHFPGDCSTCDSKRDVYYALHPRRSSESEKA